MPRAVTHSLRCFHPCRSVRSACAISCAALDPDTPNASPHSFSVLPARLRRSAIFSLAHVGAQRIATASSFVGFLARAVGLCFGAQSGQWCRGVDDNSDHPPVDAFALASLCLPALTDCAPQSSHTIDTLYDNLFTLCFTYRLKQYFTAVSAFHA